MKPTNFHTYELAVSFYRECEGIKAKAFFKSQLERASLSAVLNLQEGAAKPSKADKKRFYAIAYGSIRECQALARLLENETLFAKADELGANAYRLLKS